MRLNYLLNKRKFKETRANAMTWQAKAFAVELSSILGTQMVDRENRLLSSDPCACPVARASPTSKYIF